jgi:hypothetical protein
MTIHQAAGAGIVAVLTLQVGTSGIEPADKTAGTASFSLEAVEQSRALNEFATNSTVANTPLSLDGVLDTRALNAAEAPAKSVGTTVTDARLAGIAHARALNETEHVTVSASPLQAIADARSLNESGHVTGAQICTLPTIDGC